MPREPIRAPLGVNVPGFAMAGFQVTLHGRIWVTAEAVYAACTPGLRENDGIAAPCVRQVGF